MKKSFKLSEDNYFIFCDTIFVYTKINLRSRYVIFTGVAIDQLSNNRFTAYKSSSVKLEVLSSFHVLLCLSSLFSSYIINKLIKKYLDKYKRSNLIDTSFQDLNYGEKLGYIDFLKFSDSNVYAESCETIINYIAKNNYKNNRVIHNMYSFVDKTYAKVIYCKST